MDFIKGLLNINPSTLSGCIDIIVVKQPDGTLKCSQFHVRFGKLKLINSRERLVTLTVNGKVIDLFMKIGSTGQAFFVEQTEDEFLEEEEMTSPLLSPTHYSRKEEEETTNHHNINIFADDNPYKEREGRGSRELEDSSILEDSREEKRMVEEEYKGDLPISPVLEGEKSLSQEELEKKRSPGLISSILGIFGGRGKDKEITGEDLDLFEEEGDLFGMEDSCLLEGGSECVIEEAASMVKREPLPSVAAQFPSWGMCGDDIEDIYLSKKEEEVIIRSTMDIQDVRSGIGERDNLDVEIEIEVERNINEERGVGDQPSESPSAQRPPESESTKEERGAQSTSPRAEGEDTDVDLSLCAHLITTHPDPNHLFNSNRVTYHQFCQNPWGVLNSPNLLIKLEDNLYNWKSAAPLILALLTFKRALPDDLMDKLTLPHAQQTPEVNIREEEQGTVKGERRHSNSLDETEIRGPNPDLEETPGFGDRRGSESTATPVGKFNKRSLSGQDVRCSEESKESGITHKLRNRMEKSRSHTDLTDFSPGNVKSARRLRISHLKFRKTLIPNALQLAMLDLHEGLNEISYSVTSSLQGTQHICSRIFLWDTHTKIVISDVDGTITRSDVLGQLMPMVGKDWSHSGVARLFQNIKKNKYKILYLTSRAIGMADSTRKYLGKVKQKKGEEEEQVTLPTGPVIMSPDRLFPSLKREVIAKNPQVFKIEALSSIKGMFPVDANPFYAGFGNRHTDALSYKTVGIELGKIFIINTKGEITQFNSGYNKSYPLLNEIVNEMFPPFLENIGEKFNDFNFWKPKLGIEADISMDYDLDLDSYFKQIYVNKCSANIIQSFVYFITNYHSENLSKYEREEIEVGDKLQN